MHLLFFRVFSKDEDGCIHPDEIKFVLQHLPSQLEISEIEEMIDIVDRNKDGKISYSEFRVGILKNNLSNFSWTVCEGDARSHTSPDSWHSNICEWEEEGGEEAEGWEGEAEDWEQDAEVPVKELP